MATNQEQRTIELEKEMAVDKGKSDLVEKLVFILFPVCVSAIGWLLNEVNTLNDKITVLENKVAIVVNAENKAIPVQGTTIELEELKAAATQARADMKMELHNLIYEVKEDGMVERAEIKGRLQVLEDRYKR
jgi:cell division septum initiation protein DivIVA